MARKELRCRSVVQPNHSLHKPQPLRRPQRPASGEHVVVNIFEADSGDLTKDIERMQYFLQIHEPDLPRQLLLLDDRLQRGRGGPMPSAGFEVDEINFCHYCFLAVSYPC